MSDENTIYIGKKPPMAYVSAVLTAFNDLNAKSVSLKARGRSISTAVDVAEILRNRFMTDLQPVSIDIASEELPSYDGGTRGVSSMTIKMKRVGKPQVIEAEVEPPTKEAEEAVSSLPINLSEIEGVGKAREGKLREAGFTTVESIAASKPKELAEQTGISQKVAARLIQSAKDLQK